MTDKGKWKGRGGREAYVMTSESLNHWSRRRPSNKSGQVLLIVTLAIVVFIGSLALAADVGFWRYMKRNMQKAADAGAIGGATERLVSPDVLDRIQWAARHDAELNGFKHDENSVIVTVNNPPLSGPFSESNCCPPNVGGNAKQFVEVIVAQAQPSFFAKIFNITSANVWARAVAYSGVNPGMEAQSHGCIFTLDQSHSPSFQVQGENTRVDAECGIVVNSTNDNCALQIAGNSTVESTGIYVAGDACTDSGHVLDQNGNLLEFEDHGCPPDEPENCKEYDDPLLYVQEENSWEFNDCDYELSNINQDNGTIVLQPGVYCGGIAIKGNNLTINFEQGKYTLYGGGLSIQSGTQGAEPTITAHNVTFYNTGSGMGGKTGYGSININAGANTRFEANNDGEPLAAVHPEIRNVLFYQDKDNPKEATFNGQADTTLMGAMYFPGSDVKFTGGNATVTGWGYLVAQNITFAGGATYNITNESTGGGGGGSDPNENTPIARVMLVE